MFIKCLDPQFVVNRYTKERMFVPCGKCSACLSSKANSLKNRLQLEATAWKYVIFFTLTYNDEYLPYVDCRALNLDEFDDDLASCLEDSSPLVEAFNFRIPTFNKRDIQLFIKRIRKRLCDYETVPEHRFLRYFVASEYGPTGLRPHYHGLLFSNSDYLASHYSTIISKAWSYYDPRSRVFHSLGFTMSEFSKGESAQYTAAYCSVISHLPRLLQHKIFRPFQLYSKHPPLGFNCFEAEQVRQIVTNGLTSITIRSPDTGKTHSVPLWRSLENQLFPKCKGYRDFSLGERTQLYSICIREEFSGSFTKLQIAIEKELGGNEGSTPLTALLHKLYNTTVSTSDYQFISSFFDYESLYKLWLQSKNVVFNCNLFGFSLYDYVELIDKHYHRKEQEKLACQLQEEDDYLLANNPKNDPAVLPLLIDMGFAENLWSCSPLSREEYFKQFGYDPMVPKDYRDSAPYKQLYSRTTDWCNNTHKTRAKNEYLFYHPNLVKIQNALKKCQSFQTPR